MKCSIKSASIVHEFALRDFRRKTRPQVSCFVTMSSISYRFGPLGAHKRLGLCVETDYPEIQEVGMKRILWLALLALVGFTSSPSLAAANTPRL